MSSTKGKAKRFIYKLLDSFENNEQSTDPHLPPPNSTTTNAHSTPNLNLVDTELVQSFDALALSNSYRHHSDPNFVGGFNPGYRPANQAYVPSPPSTSVSPQRPNISITQSSQTPVLPQRSPPMPVPNPSAQSLTMQMALRPEGQHVTSSAGPPRPHSASVLSSYSELSFATSPSSSDRPNASSPTKPKRLRASSTPVNSLASSSRQQCAGVTKAGKRCTRLVKSGTAFLQAQNDAEDGDSPVEVFCFQHTKELLGPSGYYARKDGKWVDFEEWIPSHLQADTQVALRVEMEKARSQSDVPGYIYTFEIRDTGVTDTIKLKVGRAVNLIKRIDQWGKQCGSKEQVLRGWYPGTVEPDDNPSEGSLMKGRVKAGGKGPWCHRMERLVHLELADLAATGIYLDPAWPKVGPQAISSISTSATSGTGKSEPCGDCGSIHKEIFEFKRLKGRRKGKEWESIVLPVILKWGTFVDQCV
ncbi:hypothetical protein FPV67DRAFT_1463957 [Lyophyllum atratum]|nr:hypothetical protein FPV67DRAFT_1463957 [Lyophyllum atratum]